MNVTIRPASAQDASAAAYGVRELLLELGGEPPSPEELREAALALVGDDQAGALLVAEADGEIVGVLGASWQSAIHVPGRYALVQDLWVHRSWRGKAVGTALLQALCPLVRERGMRRIEVGLPRHAFPQIAATRAFYLANGFTTLGERMRWSLA